MSDAVFELGLLAVIKSVTFREVAGDDGGLLNIFRAALRTDAVKIALIMAILTEGVPPIDAAVDDARLGNILQGIQDAVGIEFGRLFCFEIENGARIAQTMIRCFDIDFGFGVAGERYGQMKTVGKVLFIGDALDDAELFTASLQESITSGLGGSGEGGKIELVFDGRPIGKVADGLDDIEP